jgi:hypothetical protein
MHRNKNPKTKNLETKITKIWDQEFKNPRIKIREQKLQKSGKQKF